MRCFTESKPTLPVYIEVPCYCFEYFCKGTSSKLGQRSLQFYMLEQNHVMLIQPRHHKLRVPFIDLQSLRFVR